MKLPAAGQICEQITAIGPVSYPAYVIQGQTKNLMIDSGVNHIGPCYLTALSNILGSAKKLDYLFLTHSHYDHVGAASYLKRHLPALRIGAHSRVRELVRKSSVLETMNRFSEGHVHLFKYNCAGEDVAVRPLEIDVLLKQGDEFDLGGLTCRVYETPGHTRDSLTFYLPEIAAVFPGDACGVLRVGGAEEQDKDFLQVEFVASYQDYVDSLKLIRDLRPQMVCLAHNWVLTGEDAAEFLERSLAETFRYRELIEHYLDAAHGDIERVVQAVAREQYEGEAESAQPSAPYMANLSAQVRHIAALTGHVLKQ